MEKECIICKNVFETGRHKETKTCGKLCLKTLQENTKEERVKKSKEAVFKKYGVTHVSHIPGFSDKVKKTNLERYGVEHISQNEEFKIKQKETMKKRYGVENSMQLESTKEKVKKTNKERYGSETYNNRDKAKETIKNKYGVEHHLQLKSILDKQIETNKKNNGVSYNVLMDKSRKNLLKSNNLQFGSDYYFSSSEYLKESKDDKLIRLREILKTRNLLISDDFDECYEGIREKNENGTLKYKKYEVKCEVCGNVFKSRVVSDALVCRTCYPANSCSKIQMELKEYITTIVGDNFDENNRDVIKPHELDFYIKDKHLAIELNGNYYHSEISGSKDKKYHISKTERCNRNGIHLIHVFEDEWILKKDIVKSKIKNILEKTDNKISVKNCSIKEITSTEKSDFMKTNHIQGDCVDKIRIGLFYKESLVAVMTFGKPRHAIGIKGNKREVVQYELIRFCSSLNTSVVGGFEKMIKYFIKTYNPKKIITYTDCRWSGVDHEKTIYFMNGFEFIRRTVPSYYYLKTSNYLERKHKFSLNKIKLLEIYGGDKNKTGNELAIENGYDRIWDCGAMCFEINFD